MSEFNGSQIHQQIERFGYKNKLLSTEEASAATGISQYELRRGAKSGRYPVIMLGDPANQFRKMRWNLDALEKALNRQQMETQAEE